MKDRTNESTNINFKQREMRSQSILIIDDGDWYTWGSSYDKRDNQKKKGIFVNMHVENIINI
jgi:hypothetical protein